MKPNEPSHNPYFASSQLTGGEFEWILNAINHAASNGIVLEQFPELPIPVNSSDADDYHQKQITAAWTLKQIALEAITALDRLPIEAQSIVAAHAEAWPNIVRQKITTSAKNAGVRIASLGLGNDLPVNLDHTAVSVTGEKVPIAESKQPGNGLANHLRVVLSQARENEGLAESAFSSLDPALVCATDPNLLADALASAPFVSSQGTDSLSEWFGEDELRGKQVKIDEAVESKKKKKRRTAVGRKLHRDLLIATLPELNPDTSRHWALAGLRYLQCENNGFLVHDIISNKKDAPKSEKLSPWIPEQYWADTKTLAAKRFRNAMTELDYKTEAALMKGFRLLSKGPAK